jgi:hypothetical protein
MKIVTENMSVTGVASGMSVHRISPIQHTSKLPSAHVARTLKRIQTSSRMRIRDLNARAGGSLMHLHAGLFKISDLENFSKLYIIS